MTSETECRETLEQIKKQVEPLPYVKEVRLYSHLQAFVVFKRRLRYISVFYDAYQGWTWRGTLNPAETKDLDQVRELGAFLGVDNLAKIGLD